MADMLSLISILDSQVMPYILLHKGSQVGEIEIEAVQVLLDFSSIKGDTIKFSPCIPWNSW
jgi:hypothetical protein